MMNSTRAPDASSAAIPTVDCVRSLAGSGPNGAASAPRSRLVSGYSFASRSNTVASAALASPTVAPGRSRPSASTQNALRLAAQFSGPASTGYCTSGTQRSGAGSPTR